MSAARNATQSKMQDFECGDIVLAGDSAQVMFEGLPQQNVAASDVLLLWRKPGGQDAGVTLAVRRTEERDGSAVVSFSRDDMLAALSATGDSADGKVWLGLASRSGNTILSRSRHPKDRKDIERKLRAPQPGELGAPAAPGGATKHPAGRLRRQIVMLSDEERTIDIARLAGIAGANLHAERDARGDREPRISAGQPPMPANGGRIHIRATELSGFRCTETYSVIDRTSGERVPVDLHFFRIGKWLPALVAALVSLLGTTGAWAFARSLLSPEPIGVSVLAGQTKVECLRFKKPSLAQVRVEDTTGLADLSLQIDYNDKTCDSGHSLKVTTGSKLPVKSYTFRYAIAYTPTFLGSVTAPVTVHVGESPILDVRDKDDVCIDPGSELVVELPKGPRFDPKGFPISVRSDLIQIGLVVDVDPQDPQNIMRRTFRVPPLPHLGELVYTYKVIAGGIESRLATIKINDKIRCSKIYTTHAMMPVISIPSAQTPVPAPAKGPGATSQGPMPIVRPSRMAVVVPARGGMVLAYEGVSFTHSAFADLPTVNVTRMPSMALKQMGQFFLLEGSATPGSTDVLEWEVVDNNTRHILSAQITYRELCVSSEHDQALVYLPRGRYHLPPRSRITPPEVSALEGLRTVFFPTQSDDYRSGSFMLDAAICIQAQEQQAKSVLAALGQTHAAQRSRSYLVEVTFNDAVTVAAWKTRQLNSPGKFYSVPKDKEWLAGFIVGIEAIKAPSGTRRSIDLMHASYLDKPEEWIDRQPTLTDQNIRIEAGPYGGDWARRVSRLARRDTLGVRFVRIP